MTHASLAGKTIVFRTSSGAHLCTATTNAAGLANLLAALVGLRYSATFNGDLDNQPSTTEGAIAQINGIRLL